MTENGHESESKNKKYTRQGAGQLQDLLLEKDNTIKVIKKRNIWLQIFIEYPLHVSKWLISRRRKKHANKCRRTRCTQTITQRTSMGGAVHCPIRTLEKFWGYGVTKKCPGSETKKDLVIRSFFTHLTSYHTHILLALKYVLKEKVCQVETSHSLFWFSEVIVLWIWLMCCEVLSKEDAWRQNRDMVFGCQSVDHIYR